MLLYVLAQFGRTLYAVESLNETTDQMMKHILGPMVAEKGLDIDRVKIGFNDPGRYSLAVTVDAFPVVLDLQYKLLLNVSGVEFVTSDNPVILYNQLLSFRKGLSSTGLMSKGLQIFLPIGPDKMLFFYDQAVYRVGNSHKRVIIVNNPKDVYELNVLQMSSSLKNIYFNDPNIDIESLHKKASPFFLTKKTTFNVYPTGETTDGYRQELLANSRKDIKTNLKLSFLSLLGSAKKWRSEFCKQDMQPAVINPIKPPALLVRS